MSEDHTENSSPHSLSDKEELDAKTPTVAKRETYLSNDPSKNGADGDDEEEEGSTDEEEDDEEEGSDEEEEPVLKYERIGKSAAEILEKDAASAIAVGETYFVRFYKLSHLIEILNIITGGGYT